MNDEELEKWFRQTCPIAYRTAMAVLHNHAEAEDVAAQVVQELVPRARAGFAPDTSWEAFIAVSSRRRAVDCLRRKRRRREVPFPAEGQVVDQARPVQDQVEERDLFDAIRRGIDQLPERDRVVIKLHFNEGVPLQEIARRVGRGEEAVKRQHSRGVQKLRKLVHRS